MSEPSEASYIVKDDGPVWEFTINRPERRNALIWEVRDAILSTVRRAERARSCRVLIVTGAGTRAFCAGGDVDVLAGADPDWPNDAMRDVRAVGEIARALMASPLIVVSAVNGIAFGGGCILALAGDIVVANGDAKFGFGFAKAGLVPDWAGTYLLPRLVGLARAKDLVLRGRTLSAAQAQSIGLIATVVQHDALDEARQVAREIAGGPPIALGLAKQLLLRSFESGLDASLLAEQLGQTIAGGTRDHREALAAFSEQRSPVFSGR